ncbi:cytochrome P450 [Paenibacillus sp. LBL]|uniref:cytochrome P450 n=1 Tax=Paenibacillus TaxID=44249 RepID=UPI002474C2B7|nr:cytochrome P450 [Paenibacillus sp. LBL]MDH6670719.1 cytochrome P450 [Paenibacillus sp. LBL]
MNRIPGPHSAFGWRINMFHFFRSPFAFQQKLLEGYGKLSALGQSVKPSAVFAFGPELNRQILSNPNFFEMSTALVKIPKDTVMGDLFYHNLLLMSGEKHKEHRRLIQPAFLHSQIERYGQDMTLITEQLADEWRGRTLIDVNTEMKKLTQRIALKTLFGVQNSEMMDTMGMLINRFTKSFLLATLAPLNIPFTPYRRSLRNAQQLNTQIRSMIHEKRQESDATDVLAALIRGYDEEGSALSDEELVGHAFSIYTAGHETTANALTWAFFLLVQHPNIYANLMEELNAVMGGSHLTQEKLSRLSLLDYVVKESLRLLPPASIGTRITNAPCELDGYALPEGTNVFFSQFITHRLPELYEDPNYFKPHRWQTIKPSAFEFLPFSAGPHMCIGWHFAMQELKIVLAVLLQRFNFSLVRNAKITPNLMMRPVHGMPMHISLDHGTFERVDVRGTIHRVIEYGVVPACLKK